LAPNEVDEEYVGKACKMLSNVAADNSVGVVVGGGRPARKAIEKARKAGASQAECDYMGILSTRDNARALISAYNGAVNTKVPESLYEATRTFGEGLLVMGGTEPGHSTDAVAALLADWVGADVFINASNVDAVYDRDPKKHVGAKPLDRVHIDELIKMLDGMGSGAGEYPLFDLVALKIIKRSNIRTLVVDGRDVDNLFAASLGQDFRGSEVVF